jgi:hypothetical protein
MKKTNFSFGNLITQRHDKSPNHVICYRSPIGFRQNFPHFRQVWGGITDDFFIIVQFDVAQGGL